MRVCRIDPGTTPPTDPVERMTRQIDSAEFRPARLPPGVQYTSIDLGSDDEHDYTAQVPASHPNVFFIVRTGGAPIETMMAGPFDLADPFSH